MRRSGKVLIAPSAASALGNHHAFVGPRKIMHHLAGFVVIDDRADRNFQRDAVAFRARAGGAFSMTPALGLVLGVKAEVNQRVVPLAGFHDDVAASSPIAATGSSARYKLLPAECHAAVAAGSGCDTNFGFVHEHRYSRPL